MYCLIHSIVLSGVLKKALYHSLEFDIDGFSITGFTPMPTKTPAEQCLRENILERAASLFALAQSDEAAGKHNHGDKAKRR